MKTLLKNAYIVTMDPEKGVYTRGYIIVENDRIEGIVTDGDVRRAMEKYRADFFNIRAMDIATRNPKTITADQKLIAAEKRMTENKINSLLVTSQDGRLEGVIQLYDIKL